MASRGTRALFTFYCFTAAHDTFVAYGALYLMVPGLSATTPILSTWLANNSEPYYRRATSIALGFIAVNSVFLFFWSYSFLSSDSFWLRVVSLAYGDSPRRKRQGTQKQQLCFWYCKSLTQVSIHYFGRIILTIINPAPSASSLVPC